jgi:hypothetical protein
MMSWNITTSHFPSSIQFESNGHKYTPKGQKNINKNSQVKECTIEKSRQEHIVLTR